MRVAITGASGVIGRHAVTSLIAAGHQVRALSRGDEDDLLMAELGAEPVRASLFDSDQLAMLVGGCDAVANLATSVPVGLKGFLPGAWRDNTRIRTDGARAVLAAAAAAGVRRVVQESVSILYADQGDGWIDETSPLDISAAIEPSVVAESHVQDFADDHRAGVVLRLGGIVGDDPFTRYALKLARQGRPLGLGDPDGWAHLVHTDDLGPAVLAALEAPSGIYNVGAAPARRREVMAGYAAAAGVEEVGFLPGWHRRLAGPRVEALARSLRVRSDLFTATVGWEPTRGEFSLDWLESSTTPAPLGPV